MITQAITNLGEINITVINIFIQLPLKSIQVIAHSRRVVSIFPTSEENLFSIVPLGFLSKNYFYALITL